MRHILKTFSNDVKMRNKLLILFLLIGILPIFLVSVIIVIQYSNQLFKQTYSLNETRVEQLKLNIENYYDGLLMRIDNISMDDVFIGYINSRYAEEVSFEEKHTDFQKIRKSSIDKYISMSSNGEMIRAYTTNPYILYDNNILFKTSESDMDSEWYKGACAANGASVINVVKSDDDASASSYFVISKKLNYSDNAENEFENILTIWIREDNLYNFIKNENPNNKIFILSSNDAVITSNVRGCMGKLARDILDLRRFVDDNADSLVTKTDNTGDIVFLDRFDIRRSHYFGRVITICSVSDLAMNIRNTNKKVFMLLILFLAISCMLLVLLSRQITTRLKKLVNTMNGMDLQNINPVVSLPGRDEIGYLSRSFEKMLKRLKTLIDESYIMTIKMQAAEIHKNKMELNALQSQINPHFLYNIMESVRMSLLENDDVRNAAILQKYATLIRNSLEWGNDRVTVEQELEMVKNYFDIQKYRFEDRFDFNINIHDSVKSAFIPKLTLMPLIENAFEHGIADIFEGGHIEIFSCVTEIGIEIVVADNGAGIPYEKLCKIKNQLKQEEYKKEDRIGIYNVHRRVQLMYGKQYGLIVDSVEGAGSLMIVLIPANRGENNI